MRNAMLEKHNRFRELQAQYVVFITEQYVVTDQVISAATTARLEAIDLEMIRWEGVHKDEIKAFGGSATFTAPAGPGVPPSTGLGPDSGAFRWTGASARHPC